VEFGVNEAVSAGFIIVAAFAALGLGGLLFWAFRGAGEGTVPERGLGALDSAPRHLGNMMQIRQSMDRADFHFAEDKGGRYLSARLRRERRQVIVLYLGAIRRDFEQSLRIARIIAVLSPEVSGSQEYERLRLSLVFRWRFQMIKLRLLTGNLAQDQVVTLGEMATSLAVQMEETMARLGERAALAAELALQSDR
jgi:hypothetical protein